MEVCYWALLAACVLAALGALARLWSVRRGIREVAAGLTEKMQTETNTLLCLSTGDRAVRALANEINAQLQALRAERLRLQHGDAALKSAITNISHDLRTPLTAICGYLELLEEEPLTPAAILPSCRSGRRPCAALPTSSFNTPCWPPRQRA